MDTLTISAASGMKASTESLELLANNLANAGTEGYKKDGEFYSLFVSPDALAAAQDGVGPMPATLPVIQRQWTDFSSGTLRATGNSLDIAISGKGFLRVNGSTGPLYTRNGSLRVSPAGVLVTPEGHSVSAVGGKTLTVQSSSPLEIATDGTVRQDGQELGQLELVEFPDTNALVKQGGSCFRIADAAAAPQPAQGSEILQGKLEGSNVGTAESAVRLVGVMRHFEMLQKAVSLGAEMNRRAVEEVAKVGS